MRRYFLILMLLAGCIAEPIDEQDEIMFVDEDPGISDGSYSGVIHFDSCAPTNEVMDLDGHEIVIEIPVECHPLDLPYLWWDDYHDGVTNPVDQELQLQEQEKY